MLLHITHSSSDRCAGKGASRFWPLGTNEGRGQAGIFSAAYSLGEVGAAAHASPIPHSQTPRGMRSIGYAWSLSSPCSARHTNISRVVVHRCCSVPLTLTTCMPSMDHQMDDLIPDPHRLPAPGSGDVSDLPLLRSRTPTPSAEDRALFNASLSNLTFRSADNLLQGEVHPVGGVTFYTCSAHSWFCSPRPSLLKAGHAMPTSMERTRLSTQRSRRHHLYLSLTVLPAHARLLSSQFVLNTAFTWWFTPILPLCPCGTFKRFS